MSKHSRHAFCIRNRFRGGCSISLLVGFYGTAVKLIPPQPPVYLFIYFLERSSKKLFSLCCSCTNLKANSCGWRCISVSVNRKMENFRLKYVNCPFLFRSLTTSSFWALTWSVCTLYKWMQYCGNDFRGTPVWSEAQEKFWNFIFGQSLQNSNVLLLLCWIIHTSSTSRAHSWTGWMLCNWMREQLWPEASSSSPAPV